MNWSKQKCRETESKNIYLFSCHVYLVHLFGHVWFCPVLASTAAPFFGVVTRKNCFRRVHACRQASTTDKGIPRTNGVGKETQSRPVIFGLPKDGDGDTSDDMGSRDPSPKPLLSRLNSHPKLFRGPSFSKVSLAPTPEMEILTSDDPVRPRTDSSLRWVW